MEGYGSAGQVSQGTIDAMLAECLPYRLDAVEHACKRFSSGQVDGRNNAFPPSAAELCIQVRLYHDILERIDRDRADRPKLVVYKIGETPPPPLEALGPIKVDFGQGTIDMTDMTLAEKEAVLQHKGLPPADDTKQIGLKPKTQGFGR